VIPAATRYARASDVDHALELLGEPEAKALAGGQSLIPVMKLRVARPGIVVDISRLDLRGVREEGDVLHVGPLTTWAEIAVAEAFERPALAAMRECALGIGDLQVRNRGTIGGSVVHADPASDMPAVLLALGASVHVRSLAGFALAGAAALVRPGLETVALTGVGATPFVLREGDARDAIAGAEIFGDRFASEEYRRELARVVAIRALGTARARAEDDR
jgi:carbon-monoxide dehydrogenase medium subunit